MGFVLLSGLFEPGTSVSLVAVSEDDFAASYGEVVGRRLVDSDGSLGFDGLEDGARFIAAGFDVYGKPVEVRCRALRESQGGIQAPIRPIRTLIGLQESP